MIDNLHESILLDVLKYMDYKSVEKLRCVNTYLSQICDLVFNNTRQLLNSDTPNSTSKGYNEKLFLYETSLKQDGLEYWAYIALYNTKNMNLYNNIKCELLRYVTLEHNMVRTNKYTKLTHEQRAIVHCAPQPNKIILVQAFAGSGKTTTLSEYIKQWKDCRILYLAYNKSLAMSTKNKLRDCDNVDVYTIHSFALNYINEFQRFTIGELDGNNVMKVLETLTAKESRKVIADFSRYCNSDDIDASDLYVTQLWDAMFMTKSIPVSHDAYLKKFHLMKKHDFDYDVVMVDEVQDSTDCVLDIVCNMNNTTKIFVGDTFQKIYGYKYVNEPYDYISNFATTNTIDLMRFKLSTTFRFGYDLMSITNSFLKHKFKIDGFTSTTCTENTRVFNQSNIIDLETGMFIVANIQKNTTIICRTNTYMYNLMFYFSQNNITFNLHNKNIDFNYEIQFITDLIEMNSNKCENDVMKKCKTIENTLEYVTNMGWTQWMLRIKLFLVHGNSLLGSWLKAKQNYTSNDGITLITAHQSKGLEFDHVVMGNDFQLDHNNATSYLLYVAMTRATKSVYINNKMYTYLSHKHNKSYIPIEKKQKYGSFCTYCDRHTSNFCMKEDDSNAITTHKLNEESYIKISICNRCMNEHVNSIDYLKTFSRIVEN